MEFSWTQQACEGRSSTKALRERIMRIAERKMEEPEGGPSKYDHCLTKPLRKTEVTLKKEMPDFDGERISEPFLCARID
jgi:hypothetical protein